MANNRGRYRCLLSVILLTPLACAHSAFEPNRVADAPAASRRPADWQFWWGISTASYQVEDPGPPQDHRGFKTDWDYFYERGDLKHPRDCGTWSYSHTARDIAAMKALGVTHYRFSIEWARVEPRPGAFNDTAIAHYVQLARDLKAAGITPIVTLWHFTFPSWLADTSARRHGWLHPLALKHWEPYVRRVVSALADEVRYFAPQNEPNAYALAHLFNEFPPRQIPSYPRYLRELDVQADAFLRAAKIIRDIRPDAIVLSVQAIMHWQRASFDLFGFWYTKAQEINYYHLDQIAHACDWIGFNYYMREIATPLSREAQRRRSGFAISDAGWFIDPDGLYEEIAALEKRYGKPMLITENGLPDAEDHKRPAYLREHVAAALRAVRDGYDLRGYFHWSLIDNYEWAHGYTHRFGLFALDPETHALMPKESAQVYRALISGRNDLPPIPAIPAQSTAHSR